MDSYDSSRNSRLMSKHQMSLRAYNLTIGAVLLWGFLVNLLMCTYCTNIFLEWNFTAVIIGYFVVCILGMFMSFKSSSPVVSFIGYNMVVVPVGVLLSIALAEYDHFSVMNALIITTVVTFIMIGLAAFFPDFFLSLGKVLFFSLTTVVVCELIFLFTGFYTPTIWDWLVALIFCGYIGFDWAEAQQKPRTLDNAIDSVVGLYLDIVNLFLRVLSSSSKSRSSRSK